MLNIPRIGNDAKYVCFMRLKGEDFHFTME